ncbi:MAG: hypothetical protein LBK01_08675 [Burkholderiaceae bacterium]|jgi:hypothetical protein|nr:hypothetical protein [Burkholderiaceae bacterium]
MHSRQAIREAVYQKLSAHPDLATLFYARTKSISEEDLPAGDVVTGSETVESASDQWQELRTVQLHVLLYAQNTASVADTLDTLAEVVEQLLSDDQTLGGLCTTFQYAGCDPDYESAATYDMAILTMNYTCRYVWQRAFDLGELSSISVGIDMASPRNDPQIPAHPDGQIDAEIEITLPQGE